MHSTILLVAMVTASTPGNQLSEHDYVDHYERFHGEPRSDGIFKVTGATSATSPSPAVDRLEEQMQRSSNTFLNSLFRRYGQHNGVLSYSGLLRLFAKMGIRTDQVFTATNFNKQLFKLDRESWNYN